MGLEKVGMAATRALGMGLMRARMIGRRREKKKKTPFKNLKKTGLGTRLKEHATMRVRPRISNAKDVLQSFKARRILARNKQVAQNV